VALVLLALLAWGFVLLIKHILDPAAQAPGISLGRVAAFAPSAQGHR
jgi:hypothetical protein